MQRGEGEGEEERLGRKTVENPMPQMQSSFLYAKPRNPFFNGTLNTAKSDSIESQI